MFVPPPSTLAVYLAATVALVLTPGPDTLFVLSQAVRGRGGGVRAALGVATGVCLHTAGAALGLSALLRTVPGAFAAVKYAGAAYLLALGARTAWAELDGSGSAVESMGRERTQEGGRSVAGGDDGTTRSGYRGGVLVNALNPKVALFFLAFLPGFATGPPDTAAVQMAVLGGLYAAVTATYLSAVALLADRARRTLAAPRAGRALRLVAAGALLALGASLAIG